MAARTNKRDPRAARTLRRISFVREVKQSFLIICEGVNTEPDYFNAFRLTSANIKAVGQAPEPTLSENIIKLQIIDNHILSTMQSKSKSF